MSAIQQAMQDEEQGGEINLLTLSLQQLRGLQQQFTQQVEVMTREFGNLKMAHSKFQNALASLDDMNEKNEDAEVLMPLTSSIYVPGRLKNVGKILVDVGTGYVVEKSREEAAVYIKGKLALLQSHLTNASQQINRTQSTLETINVTLRERVQQAIAASEAQGGAPLQGVQA